MPVPEFPACPRVPLGRHRRYSGARNTTADKAASVQGTHQLERFLDLDSVCRRVVPTDYSAIFGSTIGPPPIFSPRL